MYRILIVEDDCKIAEEVAHHLVRWGYETAQIKDFGNIMESFKKFMPQLVLMDIGLPLYNGYYWCTEIRKVSQVPIIFISSASDNMNVVMAMNLGADDFIVKPFDLEVLSAKIQAILRRTYSYAGPTLLLEYKGVMLSIADMMLLHEKDKLALTKNEFRILQILFELAGNIFTREDIMKRLWDNECFVDDNTLTVNVNRLRKSLENIGLVELIVTKKGVGYQLGEYEK